MLNTLKKILFVALTAFLLTPTAQAECKECKQLLDNVDAASKNMNSSLTSTGALTDLPQVRQAYRNLIYHLRMCEECRKEIPGDTAAAKDQEIDTLRRAIEEQLDSKQRELEANSKTEGTAAGALIGGLLYLLFGD